MTSRIVRSSCGLNIWPKGVFKTVSGREVIYSGMPLPTRNMAKSLVKLLQLWANKSYDWQVRLVSYKMQVRGE